MEYWWAGPRKSLRVSPGSLGFSLIEPGRYKKDDGLISNVACFGEFHHDWGHLAPGGERGGDRSRLWRLQSNDLREPWAGDLLKQDDGGRGRDLHADLIKPVGFERAVIYCIKGDRLSKEGIAGRRTAGGPAPGRRSGRIRPIPGGCSNAPDISATDGYAWTFGRPLPMRSKAYLGLWSIGCLVILLIRCTPQGPQNPNTVTVGSIGEAQRLLPMLASDSASGDISGWVFNGLVKYDKHLNLIGDLAESFEASDDCLTVTFHLRKGVQWQDGKELTAEDVLFTYQKMIDPNVATPYSGDFERVAKVDASHPYTLKVTYKEPFAPGLASWGIGIIPKHLLSGVDLNTTDFNRKPIGTGPYKMKEWVTGQKIVLAANDHYFEGRPKVEE